MNYDRKIMVIPKLYVSGTLQYISLSSLRASFQQPKLPTNVFIAAPKFCFKVLCSGFWKTDSDLGSF